MNNLQTTIEYMQEILGIRRNVQLRENEVLKQHAAVKRHD